MYWLRFEAPKGGIRGRCIQQRARFMDAKAKVALESAVHRTLHAHAFSRSSSQASLVLTDLLSRYLTLLASTCAKYAQHAGRTDLTPQDALCALNEMGVNMEEVDEYRSTEAVELARYAANTARRVEELKDFTCELVNISRHDVVLNQLASTSL